MKNMTLDKLAKAVGGTLVCDASMRTREIMGVVLDSRKVEKDFLFVATVGARVDGHSFIAQVAKEGALAVLCERVPEVEIPYILVDNSFRALRAAAAYYRRQLGVKVVGITGSVGKTSTKEVIANVLSRKFRVCKTQGNFNNEVGVPLTIFSIRETDEIAVLELGINHFGEMHRLGEMAMPDVCVFTNIGQCHLEFLGSRDGILKAKTELLEHMNQDAVVVLNGDDDKLCTITDVHGKRPVFYGTGEQNTYRAVDIVPEGVFGSRATIVTSGGRFETFMPLPGEHMVWNAVAATAVGEYFGMTTEEIDAGIRSVQSVGGRSNLIRAKKYTVIDDCYNANPNSMKAAISLLKMADSRKVAVLGDMFELGENESSLHAEVGVFAVQSTIDVLICVGTLSRAMYEAAENEAGKQKAGAGPKLYYFETKEELLFHRAELFQTGDTILIKASHGMEFSKLVTELSGEE